VPRPDAGGWCGAGSGWQTYGKLLHEGLGDLVKVVRPEALCHARDAAVLGAARFAAGDHVDAAMALPVYLRDRVAWKKGEAPSGS